MSPNRERGADAMRLPALLAACAVLVSGCSVPVAQNSHPLRNHVPEPYVVSPTPRVTPVPTLPDGVVASPTPSPTFSYLLPPEAFTIELALPPKPEVSPTPSPTTPSVPTEEPNPELPGPEVEPAAESQPSPSSTKLPRSTHQEDVPVLQSLPLSMFGLHVPWALPGDVRLGDDSVSWKGQWPNVPFASLRLWDTGTAWVNLEPQRGVYRWSTLDRHVATARKKGVKDITLVIAGTPEWAATAPAPGSASWVGKNTAALPKEADWVRFIEATVKRYKGKITAYQIGNEVNTPKFWQGTPEQLARLTRVAYSTIKKIDPKATVVGPSVLISENVPVAAGSRWVEALAQEGWPVDVATIHVYPSPAGGASAFRAWTDETMTLLRSSGWDGPVWATEVSYLDRDGVGISGDQSRFLVSDTYREAFNAGLSKVFWYAWSPAFDDSLRSIVLLQPGSPAAQGYANAITPTVPKKP